MVLMHIVVFESSKYNVVGRFAMRHFQGGFRNGKMTACLNGYSEDLISFRIVYWM